MRDTIHYIINTNITLYTAVINTNITLYIIDIMFLNLLFYLNI